MKRCKHVTCWTDCPFDGEPSRIRHVQVLCYDGDKYVTVMDLQTGEIGHVKAGYLYRKAEAVKILRDVEDYIRDKKKLGKRRVVNWIHWPKTINRRKLERMIPHFVD